MVSRKAAADRNRERILEAARALLLAEDFSEFSMDAVARKAGVIRFTVYYQFQSKAGLLEALYDYIARNGDLAELAEVFRRGNDPLQKLHGFLRVFAQFWQSDRVLIRRLHALGAIDAEIGQGLRARNERRRNGLRVIVESYGRSYQPFTPLAQPIAIDTLYMITSFETFDALMVPGRSFEETVGIIQKIAERAIGFIPKYIPAPKY